MFVDPNIGDSIHIEGNIYTFIETPGAPDVIYAEIGRKAKVYRVVCNQQAFALKTFKPKYRLPELIGSTELLRRYEAVPGLKVAHRTLLTPEKNSDVISKNESFNYSILMPWVEGQSWFNLVTGRVPITTAQSLRLAHALTSAVSELEQRDLAHCDLSSSNFVFSVNFSQVELIDIEDMFGYGLKAPTQKSQGTGGYAPNWMPATGAWEAAGDRFALGILVSEILGWALEDIRMLSEGDAYFASGEAGHKSQRSHILSQHLEQIHPELANLFKTVWFSESFEECPRIADWKRVLDSLFIQPAISIQPDVLDFGLVALPIQSSNPPRLRLIVTNMGSGIADGGIAPEVPWLAADPTLFQCIGGQSSVHTISLGPDVFCAPNQKSYSFQKVISVQTSDATHYVPVCYQTQQPKRIPGWAPITALIAILLGFILYAVAKPYTLTPVKATSTPLSRAAPFGNAAGNNQVSVTRSAANMNLVPSDIGPDFYLEKESPNQFAAPAIDGNARMFVNGDRTWYVSGDVLVFPFGVSDDISALATSFETTVASGSPSLSMKFDNPTPIQIGDQAAYVQYSAQGTTWKGTFVIIKQGEIVGIVDVLNGQGLTSVDKAISYTKTIEGLIAQPRDSARLLAAVPTQTPISTLQAGGLSAGGFATYRHSSGSFSVDLPSQGCMEIGQSTVQGTSCQLPNTFGMLNVMFTDFAGSLTKDTVQLMAQQMLENMKPIGMLVSYSNLAFVSSDNGMYVYSFSFKHQNQGDGQGFVGYEVNNGKLFAIQFLTFDMNTYRKYWDRAYSTFQAFPK